MKILHISDTHNLHHTLNHLPDADIIIHSGDFTVMGSENEAIDFMNWFCDLPYRHKIFLTGNHDTCMLNAEVNGLPENVHLLNNSNIVIDGIKICGISFFNIRDLSGEKVNPVKAVPADSDIIITHQPPLNILDFSDNIHYGSFLLRERIMQVRPSLHLFGHVHNNYGIIYKNGIVFSNAALLDATYKLAAPRLLCI